MTGRVAIHTDAAPAAIGPYGQAIRAGGLIFASGQIGADPQTGALADGVAAQADRALRNLAAVLAAAGSGLDRVVKTIIFLTSMDDFVTVNEVYASHLAAPYPARSTIAVKALPKGALVEIEVVALANDGSGEPERS
jgi:2-iminobutanoate/2-iminopropanoate deaminase